MRAVVYVIRCARRGHLAAEVVDDEAGRWLEIRRFGSTGTAKRVELSWGFAADRIGCACRRHVLIGHIQIIESIQRGDAGMTI